MHSHSPPGTRKIATMPTTVPRPQPGPTSWGQTTMRNIWAAVVDMPRPCACDLVHAWPQGACVKRPSLKGRVLSPDPAREVCKQRIHL